MRLALTLTLSALPFAGAVIPEEPKTAFRTDIVLITGFKFVPEKLEVNAGDTVIWKNEDIVPLHGHWQEVRFQEPG